MHSQSASSYDQYTDIMIYSKTDFCNNSTEQIPAGKLTYVCFEIDMVSDQSKYYMSHC